MIVHFPVVPSGLPATNYLNLLVSLLTRIFTDVVSKNEETPRVVLRSPNGTLFDLTVSDTGTLIVNPTRKDRA